MVRFQTSSFAKIPGCTRNALRSASESVFAKGYLKGVLMNMFSHCLPDDTFAPQTSCTAEMFFGSINTKGNALAYPFFHRKGFCFVPELLALLGSSDSFSDKMHIFNEVLECQQIERSLIKFSNAL